MFLKKLEVITHKRTSFKLGYHAYYDKGYVIAIHVLFWKSQMISHYLPHNLTINQETKFLPWMRNREKLLNKKCNIGECQTIINSWLKVTRKQRCKFCYLRFSYWFGQIFFWLINCKNHHHILLLLEQNNMVDKILLYFIAGLQKF